MQTQRSVTDWTLYRSFEPRKVEKISEKIAFFQHFLTAVPVTFLLSSLQR